MGDAGPGDAGSMPPETHTYVIGMINAETNDPTNMTAFGFNLDGMVGGPAGSCQDVMDYNSAPGYPAGTGIDNQLAGLAPTLDTLLGMDGVNGAIRTQIQAGKVLLILQVSDINSFTNDPSVMVHAYLGQIQPQGPACHMHADSASCMADSANMCAFTGTCSSSMPSHNAACGMHHDQASCMGDTANSCSFAGSCATSAPAMPSTECMAHADQASCEGDMAHACNWSMMASACSGIAAGQTFAMAPMGDLGMVTGSIMGGQLNATTDLLPLTFTAMGRMITLSLHSVRFGGRITANTIVNGQFGAQILVSELMATAAVLAPGVDVTGFIMPDMMPDATGAHCAALSAGMAYAAIQATLH